MNERTDLPLASVIDPLLAKLARNWRTFWPSSDPDHIAADLRARFTDAVGAWGLADLSALAGGEVALVCTAAQNGLPVLLKVNPRGHADHAQVAAEGAALAFWQPTGVVPRLVDRRDDGFTILMERVRPGHTLDATSLTWDDRLLILARLAAQLHSMGTPPDTFPHIGDYGRYWRRALAGDAALLGELEELLVPADTDVLVHADLHGGNALRAGDGWKVIDPHTVRGDRHADVWALLDPLVPALPADGAAAARTARRWLERYADAAGMDRARAQAWARLRARAEALTIDAQVDSSQEERAWAARLHRMADALTSTAGLR